MSDDLLKRAGRALQAGNTNRQPSLLDPAQGQELLARAQAAVAAPSKPTLLGTPPPTAPQGERVKLPLTCSARGVSCVVIAERRGDELHFLGHELPQAGKAGAGHSPPRLSGQYRITLNGWTCPFCSSDDIWLCNCSAMPDALHCCGTSGGRYRCACGKVEAREFVSVEKVDVRGAAVAATPHAGLSGICPAQPQQHLKRISHERSR
jgi:hypothetical protein